MFKDYILVKMNVDTKEVINELVYESSISNIYENYVDKSNEIVINIIELDN